MDPGAELLSIGELADRAGLSASTLRSWERRVGFPEPERTEGGQRRYEQAWVDRVRRVATERSRGLSLPAAVAAVRRAEQAGADSLFARIRRSHPHVETMPLGAGVMQSLTWSIEDECLVHASRPLLFGCFQRAAAYERAAPRWRELARTASVAVALSDFERTTDAPTPALVALPASSPMLNEWALVCHDPRFSALLVAFELPVEAGRERRFEALLSLEPRVVADAARAYAATAADRGLPDVPRLVEDQLRGGVPDPDRAAALLRRFALYSDRPSG